MRIVVAEAYTAVRRPESACAHCTPSEDPVTARSLAHASAYIAFQEWQRPSPPEPARACTSEPLGPGGSQFSIVGLFLVVLGAALLLGVGRWVAFSPDAQSLLLSVVGVAAVMSPPALLLMSIACRQCPTGVYIHLFGIVCLLATLPALVLPPVALILVVSGGLCLLMGPVLAVGQAMEEKLPAECHVMAWLSIFNVSGACLWLILILCALTGPWM